MIKKHSDTLQVSKHKSPKNRTIKVDIDENIDWSKPDWSREEPRKFWDPSRKLLKSIRDYQKLKKSSSLFSRFCSKLIVVRYRFWSMVTGAEIDLSCQIGGGLLIPHPNGIVIHPDSVIGINCLIFQQVTLAGVVELGIHVDIGAGAKLLGPLKLGNHVKVGANAVVTASAGDNVTLVGMPARAIKHRTE
ncbi:MAG: serine acetyltransferase [Methylotenera sp.]|jgi:serine O-acetyltransferase